MPSRLPPDFDPDWYAATYRDVGMSGLSPREHYLRFGILLGRPAKGQVEPESVKPAPKPVAEPESPPPAPARPPLEPAPSPPRPEVRQASAAPKLKQKKTSKIIARPEGFDALAAVPKPAPRRDGAGSAGLFSLETVANLQGSAPAAADVVGSLQAYARLLRVDLTKSLDSQAEPSCAARSFQNGPARIENAWLPASNRLRLMLKGHEEGPTATGSVALRAYQAEPQAPGDLHILGEGVQLPSAGPVLHDLELRHPLMPLLLELADSDGATRALALIPFPSLLPGGLHGSELKALQTEPNPMDDFWILSETLLQQAIGPDGSPQRWVEVISRASESGGTDQPTFDQDVRDWLSAVFEVAVGTAGVVEAKGPHLRLPAGCVPTIGALVSRSLGGGTPSIAGSYLVAEVGTNRPRWAIAVPAVRQDAALPSLRLDGGRGSDALDGGTSPFPLAIALRSPAKPLTHTSFAELEIADLPPLSVVLHASEASRTERLIQSIKAVAGNVEFLVRLDEADEDLRPALDRACGHGGWAQIAFGKDLRKAASEARHDILLTASDRVEVADGVALRSVLDLLNRDAKVASASCALLAEKIVKKDVVLQPASGGLFPTGVSFVSGPRLAFGEPNALDALPDMEYPVVANTLLFTAWRRSALADLPSVSVHGAANVEDIRLGLDLMRAGLSNWCTTKFSARLTGPYVPRDQIDPVGSGYMRVDEWESILGRVTLLRELF